MKKNLIRCGLSLFFITTSYLKLSAQLTFSAQLRTRSEFRDGQGAPLPENASPAFFTSQRTRFGLAFKSTRVKLNLTAQDVRVWGQDVSTINRTTTQNNNAFMLHEAWAEVLLSDTAVKNKAFSLKVGRQELVYDDQRLLGNLDWLQQARRHDAALLKYETDKWMLHGGAAFNQNQENASGTVYNPTPPGNYTASTNGGNMYKSLEFVYAGKKLAKGNVSFLFLADQFSKYNNDSTGAKVYQTGVWSRSTTGFYFNDVFSKIGVTAAAYYQFGKTASGQKINAGLLSGFANYLFNKKTSAGIGIDYYTGGTNGATSNAFDPLYGTPHKLAGLMDYYYAASGFGKKGLIDYYIKTKYKSASDKFWLTADLHQFTSATAVTGFNTRSFGEEFDLVANYALNKIISFEGGYGHYFSTDALTSATVKNVANARSNGNWAYLSINIKPEFLIK
jgi:hypothetical protein